MLVVRTFKLLLGSLGVAASLVDVVADTTEGGDTEDEGHLLGHFGGIYGWTVGQDGCDRQVTDEV